MALPQPTTQSITVAEFVAWVERPENAEQRLELINGEVIEVPSNPYSSWIVQKILAALVNYLKTNPIGYVTGEAAGYYIGDQVLSPDGAFITEKPVQHGFSRTLPQLVIEVISPTDKNSEVMFKLRQYMAVGIPVWVVYPQQKIIDIWIPDTPVGSMGIDDTLTAPDILPGFSLPIRDILED